MRKMVGAIFLAGGLDSLKGHLPIHVGDTLTDVTMGATYSAVKVFDASLEVRTAVEIRDGWRRLPRP